MSDERRDGARLITDLFVALRAAKGGAVIDERATAHDVSIRGFRLETQAQLSEKTVISFTLDLPGGGPPHRSLTSEFAAHGLVHSRRKP